jgi:hypothetical protein
MPNATFLLSSPNPFDGNRFLQRLAGAVRDRLAAAGIEIAHFKMTLAPDSGNDLGVLNLVRTDGTAESPYALADDLTEGELIVNLRAEGDPDLLQAMAHAGVGQVAREMGVTAAVEHSEHFRPGRPEPTHRMAAP